MALRPSRPIAICALVFTAIAVWLRLHNAYSYPPDWGFDASFNWRYIYRMSEDWAIPSPEAGWSTSDPPLFFVAAAALWSACARSLVVVPLFNTLLGLALVGLAVEWVRRRHPDDPARALLAGGLLLFLPAHVHMSVMVNEGMLAALLASTALFVLCERSRDPRGLGNPIAVGVASGLATLTKLSGVLCAATAAVVYAADAARTSAWRRGAARIGTLALVAALAGGWYFARNRILYGYFQPSMLPVHEVMFDMPPGERSLLDYVYVPLATFTDPRLTDPDLLRSVWGSTYASAWFDGQRFLLPLESAAVDRLGGVTLLLALLPTAAFVVGLLRAARRAGRDPSGDDAALVVFTALTLAGYAAFTWANPFFAVVKGTSLLPLALPFAAYTSDVLCGWMRGGRARAVAIGGALAALAVFVVLTSTYDLVFEKREVSGLPWGGAKAVPAR